MTDLLARYSLRHNPTLRTRAEYLLLRAGREALADEQTPAWTKRAVRQLASAHGAAQRELIAAATLAAIGADALEDDDVLLGALRQTFALLMAPHLAPAQADVLGVLRHLEAEGKGGATVDELLGALAPPEEPAE